MPQKPQLSQIQVPWLWLNGDLFVVSTPFREGWMDGATPASVADAVHPEDLPAVAALATAPATLTFDARLGAGPGRFRKARLQASPLSEGCFVLVTDIQDLSAVQGHLNAALQSLPDLLFELTPEGRYVAYHSPAERLFAPPEAFMGRRIVDIMPPPLGDDLQAAVAEAARTGSPVSHAYSLPLPDGVHHYEAHFRRSPLGTVICSVRDTTALREASDALQARNEQLASRNRELDLFAHAASHDLQEPLRTLTAFSEILAEDLGDQMDASAATSLGFIRQAAGRMRSLVRAITQLSDTRRQPIAAKACELDALVRTTHEALMSELAVEHDALPAVWGDPVLLGLLLQNLFTNAVKFAAPDRPARVRITAEVHDDDAVEVRVSDDGIGVPVERFDEVLQPFRRLHAKTKYEGSGMGLAIVAQIMDRHGGTVRLAKPTPGVDLAGAVVVFTLPAQPAS